MRAPLLLVALALAAGVILMASRPRKIRFASDAGLNALKRRELGPGGKVALVPYRDSGGVWTIGYGHAILPNERFTSISEADADSIFRRDAGVAEASVSAALNVPVSQNQFDALVSLRFNIGETAFRNSTLLRKLNAGDTSGTAAEFARWVYDNGVKVAGLVNRRAAEAQQFLTA